MKNWSSRTVRGRGNPRAFSGAWAALLLAMMVALAGGSDVRAAEAAGKSTWTKACGKGKDGTDKCQIIQVIVDGKRRRIISFKVAKAPDGLYLEVRAPLRLFIPFGVKFQVDEAEAVPMQLVECDQQGCLAILPLSAGLLAQLQSGKSITARLKDSASGKQIAINGALTGFTETLQEAGLLK